MRALLLLLLLLWASPVRAQECGTVTSTTIRACLESGRRDCLRPRTDLERLYYTAGVCWRQRALDAESTVKSATTSLEARKDPVLPPAVEPEAPGVAPYLLGGTIGALVSGLVVLLLTHH